MEEQLEIMEKKIILKISNKFFCWKLCILNFVLNFNLKHFTNIAVFLLKKMNIIKGEKIFIQKGIYIENYCQVSVGENCGINKAVKFYTEGDIKSKIIIGNNVWIARNVIFETGTHEIGISKMRSGKPIGKNIVVGDGCWIGLGAVILPGVTIGNGCIIQAGTVVFKNCKSNCIYGGNPAKLITDLSKISALNEG